MTERDEQDAWLIGFFQRGAKVLGCKIQIRAQLPNELCVMRNGCFPLHRFRVLC
jgi:hypothetical protein